MVFFLLEMLCFPQAETTEIDAIAQRTARLSSIDERFASFADACDVECGPLAPAERDRIRAEIDALVAQAYGLEVDDLDVLFADFTEAAVPSSYRAIIRSAFS